MEISKNEIAERFFSESKALQSFQELEGFQEFKDNILRDCNVKCSETLEELMKVLLGSIKENSHKLFSKNLNSQFVVYNIKNGSDFVFEGLKEFLIKEERFEDVLYILEVREFQKK